MSKAQKKYDAAEQERLSGDKTEAIIEDKEVDSIDEAETAEDITDNRASDPHDEDDQTDILPNVEKATEAQISEDGSSDDELSRLREENQALKAELDRSRRLEAELSDFASTFPEQDIRAIPDEVWQDVRKGNSLAAAFALYERKRINLETHAEEINQLNAYRSSGQAGGNTAREYFSPDEVRAMSQSEVRANYSRIVESMKRWN